MIKYPIPSLTKFCKNTHFWYGVRMYRVQTSTNLILLRNFSGDLVCA